MEKQVCYHQRPTRAAIAEACRIMGYQKLAWVLENIGLEEWRSYELALEIILCGRDNWAHVDRAKVGEVMRNSLAIAEVMRVARIPCYAALNTLCIMEKGVAYNEYVEESEEDLEELGYYNYHIVYQKEIRFIEQAQLKVCGKETDAERLFGDFMRDPDVEAGTMLSDAIWHEYRGHTQMCQDLLEEVASGRLQFPTLAELFL